MLYSDQNKLNQILKDIDKILGGNYDGKSDIKLYIEGIKKLVDLYFGGFPLQIHIPNIDNTKWFTKIYRVRRFDEIKNLFLQSEFSTPPASVCKTQRANLAFYPVFYASDNPMSCIKETFDIKLLKSEKICLSSWKINDDTSFVVTPFIFDTISASNPYRELSESILNRLPYKLDNDSSSEDKLNVVESLKFFSELFVQKDKHSLSSVLAHKYLYDDSKDRTDILIYPSVQSDKQTVNFAINPNFVDNHMAIDKIYLLNISTIDNENDQLQFSFDKYAKMENNTLKWYNVKEDDSFFLDFVNDDFGNIMVKDSLKYIKHNR